VIRAISYSEGSTLLTCQAQWDFRYGNVLAGSSLKQKDVPVLLRDGRAWGRGVAAFHAADPDERMNAGVLELAKALEEDAEEQRSEGLYDADAHREKAAELRALLEHYAETTDHLPIDRLEHELLVSLPSRSGKGISNKYKLQVLFDGIHVDPAGRTWLVEFKLRGQLSPLDLIAKSRQIRYYAWAYRQETGEEVAGVIVDERLKEVPKPARWVRPKKKDEGVTVDPDQAAELGAPYSDKERETYTGDEGKLARRTVSHAKDQITTVDSYLAACEKAGVEPDPETAEQIASRRWSQREPILLTQTEIEESGRELVSLGQQVAEFDSGDRYPVRNAKRANCNGCDFKDICNEPTSTDLVDALFTRRPPKKDREELTR
jgi:hypothetical protein